MVNLKLPATKNRPGKSLINELAESIKEKISGLLTDLHNDTGVKADLQENGLWSNGIVLSKNIKISCDEFWEITEGYKDEVDKLRESGDVTTLTYMAHQLSKIIPVVYKYLEDRHGSVAKEVRKVDIKPTDENINKLKELL